MPDVFTKKKRSDVMRRIRSRGNKDTELVMMRVLRRERITGWRRHDVVRFLTLNSSSQVRPDFVFRKSRVTLFVDGCFWHGCKTHCRMPEGSRSFWKAKLVRNMARDTEVTRSLRRCGWRALRVWEHELSQKNERRLLARLRRVLS